jgi:hypothetical protein
MDGGAQGAHVARRDDQPGVFMADETAGGGSYSVGGNHGESLMEGFVDHEPPRLEEVACGERRHY